MSDGNDVEATVGEDGPGSDGAEVLAAADRRARFRQALEAIGSAPAASVLRWVLVPASLAVVAGFVLMILGWWGAASTAREIEQIPYLISGGLIGLGLVFVGGLLLATALWVTVANRMAEEAQARQRAELEEIEARRHATAASGDGRTAPARPLRSPPPPAGRGARARARDHSS